MLELDSIPRRLILEYQRNTSLNESASDIDEESDFDVSGDSQMLLSLVNQ
jgi:hypothetical protein